MTTYFITGANRGLGLEFARQLSARKGETRIIATAREPKKATELAGFAQEVLPLDAADPGSIEGLAGLMQGRPIDVLINNAGISSRTNSVETLDAADLERVFAVNSIGPMLVTRALLKSLRAGTRKTVFNITSMLGSIAGNSGGSSYGYRASKAALNMLTVSLSNELRKEGFTCVMAHPGWVQTDMGGSNAPLKPPESIAALLKIIDGLKPEDTGKFFNYDGKILPW